MEDFSRFTYFKKLLLKNLHVLAGLVVFCVAGFLSSHYVSSNLNQKVIPSKFFYIDTELRPFVSDFFALAKAHGVKVEKLQNISVQLTDLHYLDFKLNNGNWFRPAGWCFIFEATVGISRTYWNSLNKVDKKILINHELGHCVLGRVHENKEAEDDLSSIMSAELIEGAEYLEHQDYYDNELFNPETFSKLEPQMIKDLSKYPQIFIRIPPLPSFLPDIDTILIQKFPFSK